MIDTLLRVLVQVVCAPAILILIVSLSQFRYSRRATLRATGLLAALLALGDFCIVFTLGHLAEAVSLLDFVYRVANIAVVVIFAAFLVRQRAARTLFIVLSVCVGTYIIDTLALTLRALVGLYPLELALEMLLYPALILLFVRVRQPVLNVMDYMKGSLWPLCLAPAFLYAGLLLQISFPRRLVDNPKGIPMALVLCAVTVTVYVLFYHFFMAMLTKSALEQNAMAMKLSAESLEQQNALAGQNEEKMRLFRHDLRHITQMISVCLDQEDIASTRELLVFLEKNIAEIEPSARCVHTGHKLVDATLCYYLAAAREAGIDMAVCVCPMEDIAVDMTELAVALANALENAVNACKRLGEGQLRALRLDGRRRGEQYFLELVNTCAGDIAFDETGRLPVSPRAGHGIGSRRIAYFAEKNNAHLQYQAEGGWFRLRLLM